MPITISETNEGTKIESWQRGRIIVGISMPLILAGWLYQGIGILRGGPNAKMAMMTSPTFGYAVLCALILAGALFLAAAFGSVFYRETAWVWTQNSAIAIENYLGPYRLSSRNLLIADIKNMHIESFRHSKGLTSYRIILRYHDRIVKFGVGLSQRDAKEVLRVLNLQINILPQ